MAIRSFQERKMLEQEQLALNVQQHLQGNPELCGDIMELRRLGAIPRYRGPTPDDFRVRGLPHNKSERDFTIQKLRGYAIGEKMFVCTCEGLEHGNLFFRPPPTTIAKKLPARTLAFDER